MCDAQPKPYVKFPAVLNEKQTLTNINKTLIGLKQHP